MGMFDWVRSSYDLGPQLTDVECQTKDIEDGIGGTMTQYWISPDGYLYVIDYTGTHNLEMYEPGDDKYDEECGWRNFDWVPNGNHGKIRVEPITKYIEIHTSHWGGAWETWPRARIHFKYGKVQDYELFTHQT